MQCTQRGGGRPRDARHARHALRRQGALRAEVRGPLAVPYVLKFNQHESKHGVRNAEPAERTTRSRETHSLVGRSSRRPSIHLCHTCSLL